MFVVLVWGCIWYFCGDFVAFCFMDNICKLWDLNSLRCRFIMRGYVDSVNSIEFLLYFNIFLFCLVDKILLFWDVRIVSYL